MESNSSSRSRRTYRRRSEEERIADLEKKIEALKARQAVRDRKDDPILKEIPKVSRRLRKFAQLAMDHRRPDIANTSSGFAAALDRILRSELGQPLRAATVSDEE